jgi:hypothetical protein
VCRSVRYDSRTAYVQTWINICEVSCIIDTVAYTAREPFCLKGLKLIFTEHPFKCVLDFLSNEQMELPYDLPPYKEAPVLWKGLKQEADLFCLKGLKLILAEQALIHSCSPDLGDKDILY